MLLIRRYGILECLVSVPRRENGDAGSWPLLVFLHGRGEAGPRPGAPSNINQMLTLHGPLAPYAAASAATKFLIVAPQLPWPGGDVWPQYGAEVDIGVLGAVTEFHGDRTRMYLTGFSYGGNGVLGLGQQVGAPWAALWAVDPPTVPARPVASPIWVSAGKYAHAEEAAIKGALGISPTAARSDATVYEFVSPGHSEAARAAYGASKVYHWLLTNRREAR